MNMESVWHPVRCDTDPSGHVMSHRWRLHRDRGSASPSSGASKYSSIAASQLELEKKNHRFFCAVNIWSVLPGFCYDSLWSLMSRDELMYSEWSCLVHDVTGFMSFEKHWCKGLHWSILSELLFRNKTSIRRLQKTAENIQRNIWCIHLPNLRKASWHRDRNGASWYGHHKFGQPGSQVV